MIQVACPKCKSILQFGDDSLTPLGYQCPKCGADFVPSVASSAVSPGEPVAAANPPPQPGPPDPAPDEVIVFVCLSCGHTITVPREYAGTSGKCNNCGASVTVPGGQAGTSGSPAPPARSFTETPQAAAPNVPDTLPLSGPDTLEFGPPAAAAPAVTGIVIPTSAYIIGTVVILAVASLVLWLALRDSWERDNADKMRTIGQDVVALAKNGKQEEAAAKYDELKRLAGDRPIQNPEVRRVVTDAKALAESAKRRLEAERLLAEKKQHLAGLYSLESEANAFVENGEFEKGIRKYQEALDFIKNSPTADPEFPAMIARISQAKKTAAADMEQAKRQQEEERKREEEEKLAASVRATVKGRAWLTKQAGNTEPLRGLNILVLKSRGKNEQFVAVLREKLVQETEQLQTARGALAQAQDQSEREIAKAMKELGDVSSTDQKARCERKLKDVKEGQADKVRRAKAGVEEAQTQLESARKAIDMGSRIRGSVSIDVGTIYALLPERRRRLGQDTWAAICARQLAETIHADPDGKYQAELPAGSYYLYATYESYYSFIEWFLPLKISTAGDIKIDLHNDNANVIYNKTDEERGR
jgi:hypothetical protein